MEWCRLKGYAVWLLLLPALVLAGCDVLPNEDAEGETVEDVDPHVAIQIYVDTFLQEASARGGAERLFKPDDLVIRTQEVVTNDGSELCGLGGTDDEDRPEIIIAVNDGCWNVSDWDREILVFHELGHALLGRGHTDRMLSNGLRGSIMVAGRIFGLYSESRAHWRAFYVDELFDEDTPDPEWAHSE